MDIISLILGLLLGLGICVWRQRKFDERLKQMLASVSPNQEDIPSLSTFSLLRRELSQLHVQCQTLNQQIQEWENLINLAPIGYLQVDQENQLLWCNPQAQQLLNIDRWKPGQIRLLLELVRSYELDQLIENTRKSQNQQEIEWTYYTTNFEPTQDKRAVNSLALKGVSFPLSQKQVGVFLLNQQPLVNLSQSRDRSICDLTHELRTPLTAMYLVAETLEKRLTPPEQDWVKQMLKEINRLTHLAQEWLEISQINENPSQNLYFEIIEIRESINSVWQTVAPIAQQKGVNLEISGLEKIEIEADPQRLTQVLINLFDNSIKHSYPQGIVKVNINFYSLIQENDSIAINIMDEGTGFKEEDLPYIFERLYRGDPSRTRQSNLDQDQPSMRQGSGLGLSITQNIIEAHQGVIKAQNNHQTKGAWLTIILPIQQAKI
jgi:two-component system, OmpR family, phosphate regulon sensor histidine kinase PhoR